MKPLYLKLRDGGTVTRRWSASVSKGERLGLRHFQRGHSTVTTSHLVQVEPGSQNLPETMVRLRGKLSELSEIIGTLPHGLRDRVKVHLEFGRHTLTATYDGVEEEATEW